MADKAKTEVLIKLRELHDDLASINHDLKDSEQIDQETIDALGNLVTDAGAIVDHARIAVDRQSDPDESGDSGLHHDLQNRITKFETEHPRVTRFLSQLTDMLGMMGI